MCAQPRWDHTTPARRPVAVPRERGDGGDGSERPADRVGDRLGRRRCRRHEHRRSGHDRGRQRAARLFFGVVGAAQVVWGLLALVWAPRWWLALGALGNAVVVAAWLVSRTVATPVRPVRPRRVAHAVPRQHGDVLRRGRSSSVRRCWRLRDPARRRPQHMCGASRSRPRW